MGGQRPAPGRMRRAGEPLGASPGETLVAAGTWLGRQVQSPAPYDTITEAARPHGQDRSNQMTTCMVGYGLATIQIEG